MEARITTILDAVDALHALVDEAASTIKRALGTRIHCGRGCTACCTDDITVFEVEALLIAQNHADLLKRGSPHPPGSCAFLGGAGECRVYDHRPYVCRTQGLPLRWVELREGGRACELRDICPENDPAVDITGLDASFCWTLGPVEEGLSRLQLAASGGLPCRVSLRSLFDGFSLTTAGLCSEGDLAAVRSVLSESGLVDDDLTGGMLAHFITARRGGDLIACAGLEPLGEYGLLRSVAVRRPYRGMGIAAGLIRRIEDLAQKASIKTLYLATTSAERFFLSLGYTRAAREALPEAVRNTTMIARVCPSSATCMMKDLSR